MSTQYWLLCGKEMGIERERGRQELETLGEVYSHANDINKSMPIKLAPSPRFGAEELHFADFLKKPLPNDMKPRLARPEVEQLLPWRFICPRLAGESPRCRTEP